MILGFVYLNQLPWLLNGGGNQSEVHANFNLTYIDGDVTFL